TTTRSTQWLELLYIGLAVLGLTATSAQLGPYLKLGFVGANVQFWKETVATPASTFLTVDILVVVAAALIWMFGECRRLGFRAFYAWAYLFGSIFIGVSPFFPLFMAHRHRHLRLNLPEQQAVPASADFIAAALLIAGAAAGAFYSFTHIP